MTTNPTGRKKIKISRPLIKQTTHPEIMDILQSLQLDDNLPEQQTRTIHLMGDGTSDLDVKLGFDACCTCGKVDPKMIECENCHRVNYCSAECRRKDSQASNNDDDDDQALGHSAVVCLLLATCNDDDIIDDGNGDSLDEKSRTAAMDRVISEFESYPATLANVIMDGPCYQDTLHQVNKGSLIIHIVGASVDSELWQDHPDPSQTKRVFECYAEALAEIAERFKLTTIHLYFIGPNCPETDLETQVNVPLMTQNSKSRCVLKATTIRNDYNASILRNNNVTKANIVVFFNPGFTCPDYSWSDALQAIPQGTPCLVTTNTELEGVNDIEYLLGADVIQGVPEGLANMFQDTMSGNVATMEDSFFSINPHCGTRIRQSGTMANDLYVKNRWIYGGTIGHPNKDKGGSLSSKKQKIEGSGNSKRSNPALV